MRNNHNLASHVAFVDLVKAYDTANHELLLSILEKYGAPPKFVSAIERMYTDLVVVLKIEKEVEEILQGVGVRQGDNMAPVLFLFLMSAFAETLEIEWLVGVVTVQTASEEALLEGKAAIKSHSISQYTSRTLSAYRIQHPIRHDSRTEHDISPFFQVWIRNAHWTRRYCIQN